MKLHNTKVAKIMKGYKEYSDLREKSKVEGIPFDQLIKESKENESQKTVTKKAKKTIKKKEEPQIEILVKVDG